MVLNVTPGIGFLQIPLLAEERWARQLNRSWRAGWFYEMLFRSDHPVCASLCSAHPPLRGGALHKKSWAVIDRPYSLGCATVGALYERPRCIFCAKPRGGE